MNIKTIAYNLHLIYIQYTFNYQDNQQMQEENNPVLGSRRVNFQFSISREKKKFLISLNWNPKSKKLR